MRAAVTIAYGKHVRRRPEARGTVPEAAEDEDRIALDNLSPGPRTCPDYEARDGRALLPGVGESRARRFFSSRRRGVKALWQLLLCGLMELVTAARDLTRVGVVCVRSKY